MIYETAILTKSDTVDTKLASIQSMVNQVIGEHEGKVLIHEDWGVRNLAQPTQKKVHRGRYLYFMYQANTQANAELNRRLRIDEEIIRSMVIFLGPDRHQEKYVKAFKSPFSK